MALLRRGVELKTPGQLDAMRRAGLVVGRTLAALSDTVRPGMTTAALDAVAEELIRADGATPSFLGYQGFPASTCISVNDEVVHGIPGPRVLGEGDVVSIDCGAIVDGYHGDAAVTVTLGEVRREVAELLRVTEDALWAGIGAARLGGRIGDVSHAVESHVRGAGAYGIVEDFTGHGIGTAMHQPPDVPNLGRPGKGLRITEGLAIAIEPMVVLGDQANDTLDDDWTVVTRDGSTAAHFEHTVTVTPDGVWVLTALDGGRDRLERAGIAYGGR
ncbi:type I methionyl aminopeptidase [Nocardioides zeae]|uniref:Methionine aminopeptidase n=1 Tax=Nocardioides imazamoxiresistens TaxID=3231893 RepID=A0ABU3PZV9_9ACTN|nr:type I methionyl aminopeptidase [Nocardioides zeae]MDT9594327.1 type I methionyl aminopeptidase [Nocardioides zeae]